MKTRVQNLIAVVLTLACLSAPAAADGLIMVRTDKSFPDART